MCVPCVISGCRSEGLTREKIGLVLLLFVGYGQTAQKALKFPKILGEFFIKASVYNRVILMLKM